MFEFILKIDADKIVAEIQKIFLLSPFFKFKFSDENTDFFTWGDPIFPDAIIRNQEKITTPAQVINNLGGHFYYLIFNKKSHEIFIGSSLFSIFPIYFYKDDTSLFIASSPELIRQHSEVRFTFSKSFILEKLLFNYPFTDTAIYAEVKCLASNSYLRISGNSVEGVLHTNVIDWFTNSPLSGKKVLTALSDLFIDRCKLIFPSEPYYVSFTSGFDGRVLLALSILFKKNFTTFSFGKEWAEDIVIPRKQSEQLGIKVESFLLNIDNYLCEALDCGKEFSLLSNGNGNWARAHYLYTARKIGGKCNYLITGNFGSELFRAFHNPGVMVTPFLIELINATDPKSVLNTIENRSELKYIKRSEFNYELKILKEKITNYFEPIKHLPKNQILYKFLLEEVFRKYFGAEIIAQSSFLVNRTPFLDPVFVKELFKTNYAGVYSNFFENNPLKRYKGQLLYAYILRASHKQLYKLKTGKGYSPSDLLSFFGRLKIAASYTTKKLNLKKPVEDPFAVQMVYKRNKEELSTDKLNSKYFLDEKWQFDINTHTDYDNTMINYLSLNWLINLKNAAI